MEAGPALPAHSSRLEFPEEERTNGHSAALNQGLKRWCLNSPTSSSHGGPLWGTWCSMLTVPYGMKFLLSTVGSGLIVHSLLASLPCLLSSAHSPTSLMEFPWITSHIHNFFEVSLCGNENNDSSLLFQMKKPKCRENKWSIHGTAVPRWRLEGWCWSSWLQSTKALTPSTTASILCQILCSSPLMNMHVPLV